MLNPMLASGLIIHVTSIGGSTELSYGGTCFAFKSADTFLTAKHCVPEGPQEVFVKLLYDTRRVISITRHPKVDLALIRVEPTEEALAQRNVYSDFAPNVPVGGEFISYGYPIDEVSASAEPRFFRGYVQRHFMFNYGASDQCLALELSIPAPGGWSGGAIAAPGIDKPAGLVIGNYDSSTEIDSVEEKFNNGKVIQRTVIRRVISYAVCLLLVSHKDWIEDVVRSE